MRIQLLVLSLLVAQSARAQVPPPRVYVAPPPVYTPPPVMVAPPPIYVPPPVHRPPVVYAPTVYAPRPVYVTPVASPRHYLVSRVLLGVGVPLLVLGFFSMVAGIPVTVLTHAEKLCDPSPTRSCDAYYSLSYGLLGAGAVAFVSGIVLISVGRAFSIRSRFATLELTGARVALLPDGQGAAGVLAFQF